MNKKKRFIYKEKTSWVFSFKIRKKIETLFHIFVHYTNYTNVISVMSKKCYEVYNICHIIIKINKYFFNHLSCCSCIAQVNMSINNFFNPLFNASLLGTTHGVIWFSKHVTLWTVLFHIVFIFVCFVFVWYVLPVSVFVFKEKKTHTSTYLCKEKW